MRPRYPTMALMALVVGCADTTGPSLDGAPFVTATIDGTRWTMDTNGDAFAELTPDSTFAVWGTRTDVLGNNQEALGFQVGHFHATTGTYTLSYDRDPSNIGSYTMYLDQSGSDVRIFATPWADRIGQVRITAVDAARHVVAGTFTFSALQLGGTAVLQVTEGSFRVQYR